MNERVYTETIKYATSDVALARDQIDGFARASEIRIDRLEEQPRRLDSLITITCTGTADHIDDFRQELDGGGRSSDLGGLVIGAITDPFLEKARRWHRNRRRQRNR